MLFHMVSVERGLLDENARLAKRNSDLLRERGVKSFDFIGSTGSGKTELIARLGEILSERGVKCAAIAGDVAGDDDARRLNAAGIPTKSVNTGKECHLDAHLVGHALEGVTLEGVLFIENVGNLVCPGDFPLGTDKRIAVVSVTEGDDMVRKHPAMFGLCDIAVVNKADLAGVMGVDISRIESDFRRIRPGGTMLRTSAKTGEGVLELAGEMGL